MSAVSSRTGVDTACRRPVYSCHTGRRSGLGRQSQGTQCTMNDPIRVDDVSIRRTRASGHEGTKTQRSKPK